MDDKRKAEKRSLELYSRLGIMTAGQNGNFVNPHTQKLRPTMEKFDNLEASLRGLTDRLRMAEAALASEDENQIKVVSIEASKYLDRFPARQRQRQERVVPPWRIESGNSKAKSTNSS